MDEVRSIVGTPLVSSRAALLLRRKVPAAAHQIHAPTFGAEGIPGAMIGKATLSQFADYPRLAMDFQCDEVQQQTSGDNDRTKQAGCNSWHDYLIETLHRYRLDIAACRLLWFLDHATSSNCVGTSPGLSPFLKYRVAARLTLSKARVSICRTRSLDRDSSPPSCSRVGGCSVSQRASNTRRSRALSTCMAARRASVCRVFSSCSATTTSALGASSTSRASQSVVRPSS